MTFYIDVILIENIIMNYIIFLTTAIICKMKIKNSRLIIASVVGSIYAIITYMFNSPIYNNVVIKLIVSIIIIYIAFKVTNIKSLLKHVSVFYLTSFCFGGAAYYLLYCISPNLINKVNGILTGIYPIKMAIFGAMVGFLVINISFRMVKKRINKSDLIYTVEIFYCSKSFKTNILLDTGNLLKEPLTNIPVIIIEEEKIRQIVDAQTLTNIKNIICTNTIENISEEVKKRCSIIPFSSIGKENGMLVGIKPDYIKIYLDENKTETITKCIIGIYEKKISKEGTYCGLMGLNLFNSKGNEDKYEVNSNNKNKNFKY